MQNRTPFLGDLLVAVSCRKTTVLKSFFNFEYYEILNSTYFEEHVRMAASENVFIKYMRRFSFTFFQHQYQKQVKMFPFNSRLVSHEVCIHIQYFFGVVRNKLQTLNI